MSALEDEPLSAEDIAFWEQASVDIVKIDETYIEPEGALRPVITPDMCQECGETGACDYDFEGRPMMHIPRDE